MNALRNIAIAALITLPAAPAQSADFRSWLLADAPAWAQDPRPAAPVRHDWAAEACLRCHNGARATHIAVRRAGSAMQIRGFQTVNHPIGMRYDDSATRKPNGYVPRSALDSAIQLVEGRVSCVSCHQLRLDQHDSAPRTGFIKASWDGSNTRGAERCAATAELTVGPRNRDDLCIACHIK